MKTAFFLRFAASLTMFTLIAPRSLAAPLEPVAGVAPLPQMRAAAGVPLLQNGDFAAGLAGNWTVSGASALVVK